MYTMTRNSPGRARRALSSASRAASSTSPWRAAASDGHSQPAQSSSGGIRGHGTCLEGGSRVWNHPWKPWRHFGQRPLGIRRPSGRYGKRRHWFEALMKGNEERTKRPAARAV